MNTAYYKKVDLFCLLIFVVIFFMFRLKPLNGDSLLAWPIIESFVNVELYPLDDLIIKAGKEGIFYFYKLLSFSPFFKDNYPLRDFLIYLPIFYLYTFFWFLIFLNISNDRRLSLIAIIYFLFSDSKLGLNWSTNPMPMLVSISSVHWAQVFSLYLFFNKRYNFSLFFLALTGYFHPGSTISYFLVFSSVLLYKLYKTRNLKLLISLLIYFITSIPIFYLIIKNTQSSHLLTSEYFEIYNVFQYHAFLEDHFKEGYVYTFILIILNVFCWNDDKNKINHKVDLFLFLTFSLIWGVLWFFNLYFFKNTSFIHTYYVTRIFYLLKPLIILFFILTLNELINNKFKIWDSVSISLLLMTLLIFSPIVSLIIILSFVIYYRNRESGIIVFFISLIIFCIVSKKLGYANFKLLIFKNFSFNKLILFEVGYALLIFIFLKNLEAKKKQNYEKNNKFVFTMAAWLTFLLIFFTSERTITKMKKIFKGEIFLELSWKNYFGQKEIYPDYSMILNWASNIRGKMFIIPPNEYEFLSFRYLTKNGLYISEFDINQLMYSPKYYFEGFKRLKFLGLKIQGRHKTSYEDYGSLSLEELTKTNADYVIFNKKMKGFKKKNFPPIYENEKYVVYKLR